MSKNFTKWQISAHDGSYKPHELGDGDMRKYIRGARRGRRKCGGEKRWEGDIKEGGDGEGRRGEEGEARRREGG